MAMVRKQTHSAGSPSTSSSTPNVAYCVRTGALDMLVKLDVDSLKDCVAADTLLRDVDGDLAPLIVVPNFEGVRSDAANVRRRANFVCTRVLGGDEPLRQTAWVTSDGRRLCEHCRAHCAPASTQYEKRLRCVHEFSCECGPDCRNRTQTGLLGDALDDDVRVELQTEANTQAMLNDTHQEMQSLLHTIMAGMERRQSFEDGALRSKAAAVVPAVVKSGALFTDACEDERWRGAPQRVRVFRSLLKWFKEEFFKWVDTLTCEQCGGKTRTVGMLQPSADERRFGAGRVEAHQCTQCGAVTRFPRYNDASKLLETRRGRCGEWAHCFTLLARALYFDVRYVVDVTDHVWTEVFLPDLDGVKRWQHADPCENAYDTPLLYERGWGKKLSYIFACDVSGAVDVARRYTTHYPTTLTRRNRCEERALVQLLQRINEQAMSAWFSSVQFNGTLLQRCEERLRAERVELATFVRERVKLPPLDVRLAPRQTGSDEWKRARNEDGKNVIVQEK